MTFNPYLIIRGSADIKEVKEVRIDDVKVNLFADATYFSVVKLAGYGRNTLKIEALGETGRVLEARSLAGVWLPSFKDVGEDHPLRSTIGGLVAGGYITAFKDGTFKLGRTISRAELASILVKIKTTEEVTVPGRTLFKDVSRKHWAAKYIAFAVKEKWMSGYKDRTFKPAKELTRAEAVSILVKFAGLKEPKYVYENPFRDVSVKHWAAKYISAAKSQGLLDYLTDKTFKLNAKFTRRDLVEMLSRIDLVKSRLKELVE